MSCMGQLEMETWCNSSTCFLGQALWEKDQMRRSQIWDGIPWSRTIPVHTRTPAWDLQTVGYSIVLRSNFVNKCFDDKKPFRLKMISRRSGSSGSRNKSFPGSQPQSSPTWCPLEIQWKDERGETASHITPNQHLPKYVSLLDKGALPPKDLKNSILFRCSIRSKLRNNNPKEDSSYQKL